MKALLAAAAIAGLLSGITVYAEDTTGEKTQEHFDDASRAVKKAGHRMEEQACGKLTGDSKAECLAKKAKNRVKEGSDYVSDKSSELKKAAKDRASTTKDQ